MTAQTFGVYAKKIERVAGELNGSAAESRLKKVALQTKPDVAEAVKGDLGDTSMSGWRRGKPFDVLGRYEIKSDSEFEITPQRKGYGPMRVLEQGRQAYSAGDKRRKGSYKSKKTGLVTERFRAVKRNIGATRGKGTWSDAVGLMQDRVPNRIAKQFHKDLSKILGKG
jgi:hypothetical protein